MKHYTWKPVALHLCLLLQQQGFTLVDADNGGDELISFSGDLDAFVEELVACDEARIYVEAPSADEKGLWLTLYLVYGNEPEETVADYSSHTELEATLEIFEDFWSRRKTPLAEAEASWVEEIRGVFRESGEIGDGAERETPKTDEILRRNAASDQTPEEDYEILALHAADLERKLAEARSEAESQRDSAHAAWAERGCTCDKELLPWEKGLLAAVKGGAS